MMVRKELVEQVSEVEYWSDGVIVVVMVIGEFFRHMRPRMIEVTKKKTSFVRI